MIEYITGTLAELQPAVAVVEAYGIGYEINITLADYGTLQHRSEPENIVKLYIHEILREDTHTLYGFLRREDRTMFRMLNGVSGVGPGTARLILSEMTAVELQSVIAAGNDSALKSVKGIGARTAQRIIVDLRNKINDIHPSFISVAGTAASTYDEALGALTTLGFAQAAVQKVLKGIYKENPAISTEEAIRAALKAIK